MVSDPLLTILIPVYNESDSVLRVLKKIRQIRDLLPSLTILIINDGSTDNTHEILSENSKLYDRLIHYPKNQGKGFAIKVGLQATNSEYILIQDADLEYDPNEIPQLWEFVKHNNIDVLMTTRMSGSTLNRIHYFWHKIGNRFITFIFNLLNNTTYSDIYSGYIIFKRNLSNHSQLFFKGWGQQAEILTFLTKFSTRIYEAPISYYGRTYSEGKKIRFTAIFSVLLAIVVTRIRVAISSPLSNLKN